MERATNTPVEWFEPWPPTVAQREQIVAYNVGLVQRHVDKLARTLPPHVREDLLSEGYLGLLRAVDNFDPSVKVQFESYAAASVRSRCLDYLRSLDPASRTLRSQMREINKARESVEAALGHEASDDDIALFMGKPPSLVKQTQAAIRASTHASIDVKNDEGEPAFQLPTPIGAASADTTILLSSAMATITSMSRQHRIVLALHYYQRMRLQDIAREMRLPESRVSELHAEAISRIRVTVAESLTQ